MKQHPRQRENRARRLKISVYKAAVEKGVGWASNASPTHHHPISLLNEDLTLNLLHGASFNEF
jgi:hypothetical protein